MKRTIPLLQDYSRYSFEEIDEVDWNAIKPVDKKNKAGEEIGRINDKPIGESGLTEAEEDELRSQLKFG